MKEKPQAMASQLVKFVEFCLHIQSKQPNQETHNKVLSLSVSSSSARVVPQLSQFSHCCPPCHENPKKCCALRVVICANSRRVTTFPSFAFKAACTMNKTCSREDGTFG
mmetsp:Transcript_2579/g.3451  ORF Transcript_2579/g.3451 Transcript_2579/m.3451 type:complete len:109 (+) Transcript_2579:93-419(+)